MKIIITGEAQTEYPNLKELDGIDCQDVFSDYFDSDMSFVNDVSGGHMYFKYNQTDGKLYTKTVYNSTRPLTDKELEELAEYTQGQWSDGIGEGFEQHPCHEATQSYQKYDPKYSDYESQEDADNDMDVFISPWHPKQKLMVEQKD